MNGQDNMEQLLHYLPEYQVVLCKVHEYALQPDSIHTHLSRRHAASSTLSKAIATKMLQQPLVPAKPDKLIMPKPGIRPIANLQIFEDGCACKICDYVCRSIQCMEKHLRKTHFWRKRRISRPWIGNAPWETNVWCQTFFPTARRFFRVSKDAQHQRQPLGEMPTRANCSKYNSRKHLLSSSRRILSGRRQLERRSAHGWRRRNGLSICWVRTYWNLLRWCQCQTLKQSQC